MAGSLNKEARHEQINGLKRLLLLAYPERKQLLLGLVMLVVGSGTLLIFPKAVQYIVDAVLEARQPQLLERSLGLLLLVVSLQALAGAWRYAIFTAAGERIVGRLRKDLFQAIMNHDMSFFDSRQTGELTNRLASDATLIQMAVSINVSLFLRSMGAAVGSSVLLLLTSPWLTIALLLIAGPLALTAVLVGRHIRSIALLGQDAWGETGSIAAETIGSMRTVRAFDREAVEIQRYALAIDRALELGRLRIKSTATFIGVASLLGYAVIVGLLWYGSRQVLAGSMTVGALTSFVLYALTSCLAIGSLGSLWIDFMAALGAAERIFEVLDSSSPPPAGQSLAHVAGELRFLHVDFSYPQRPQQLVLHDLQLKVASRELVAIVGPSGSGKSTLAALLARFYEPNAGRIELDGVDTRQLDVGWLRRQIGFVTQEPTLMHGSIAANIRYGRAEASDAEVERVARLAHAHAFIENFKDGYATTVGERGVQLSGGQKQRIAIARALLKDPPILVLDEATSGLDAESEYLVQEALARLLAGRTTLVIAHRLSTVQRAERIVVLDRGKIKQMGSHMQLMQEPAGLYYQMVKRQFFLDGEGRAAESPMPASICSLGPISRL